MLNPRKKVLRWTKKIGSKTEDETGAYKGGVEDSVKNRYRQQVKDSA